MKWLSSILVALATTQALVGQDATEPVATETAPTASSTEDDPAASVESDGHVYFVARFDELVIADPIFETDGVRMGTLADITRSSSSIEFERRGWRSTLPRAWIAGDGEVTAAPARNVWRSFGLTRIAVRLVEPRDVQGRIFVDAGNGVGEVAADFVVPAGSFTADARGEWLDVVAERARIHLDNGDAGAAWYRSQLDHARTLLGEAGVELTPNEGPATQAAAQLQETFQLFSGGRAVSETLALDRLLPFGADADATVSIDDIRGITVTDYDWSPFIEGLEPELDPLASMLPADQHVVFFPSFDALVDAADSLDAVVASLGRQWERRSQSAMTLARYEHQLGLPLDDFARLVGPQLIKSVALTGGDSYFRVGSDVALVFETGDVDLAFTVITARIAASAASEGDVEELRGDVADVAYTGLRNADRTVSSYAAKVAGHVVVTNSLVQLERIAAAASGAVAVLSDLDEYTFFRDRYERGDARETALLILSDATIRRWCGPQLRIGSSRRARAGAVLSEVTVRALDGRVELGDDAIEVATPNDLPETGTLAIDDGHVRSDAYGTLAFSTPISELDLDYVTDEEESLYTRWREGYESGWRTFDPIAVRFGDSDASLSVDITVRPLMVQSDYESFVRMTSEGAIKPDAGDRHPEAIAHFAMALSPQRLAVMPETAIASMMMPGVDIYSWMGGSFSVYFDDDSYWEELAAADDAFDFATERFDIPIGIQAEVVSGLKLAAFLAALRGLGDSAAPGMTVWENREHSGLTYVRVGETDGSAPDYALFYTTLPGSFTVSLNEDVIRRAIDRSLERASEAGDGAASHPVQESYAWFGEHTAVSLDVPKILATARFIDGIEETQQRASWANLAILNEWQRRFPDTDPVDVHERWFARQLLCPGGGEYRWNDASKTMESTVFGHPGAPIAVQRLPAVLTDIERASFGVTFEDDGLRARIELEVLDER